MRCLINNKILELKFTLRTLIGAGMNTMDRYYKRKDTYFFVLKFAEYNKCSHWRLLQKKATTNRFPNSNPSQSLSFAPIVSLSDETRIEEVAPKTGLVAFIYFLTCCWHIKYFSIYNFGISFKSLAGNCLAFGPD